MSRDMNETVRPTILMLLSYFPVALSLLPD